MSYQVIARKWRPQSFEDVTGQEILTRTLQNSIEHGRLHHAYLFSGPRGVGKTTTARLVAKALNCHKADKPTPAPCATADAAACVSCREIAEGRSMDVLEIDAASHTGVDNVRDVIIGSVAIAPARDRYKVFIIDEVHMLSGPAFNALLKTVEEPPPRVLFIMATTARHKVPDTIISRCQLFEFRTIATARIAERLRMIADAEHISISDDAIREIARAGEGSMRDAQSALDQVASFAGEKITAADVEKALGITGADVLARVVEGIAKNEPAEALAIADDLVMRGRDLRNFCRDLLGHFRDLLVVKVAGDARLLEGSSSTPEELKQHADLFSQSDLVRFFHSLSETEAGLKEAANPRYQLEIGLVKLMEMRRLAPLAQLTERLAALEEALRAGAPVAGEKSPPTARGGGPQRADAAKLATARSRRGENSVAAHEVASGSFAADALAHGAAASVDAAMPAPALQSDPFEETELLPDHDVGHETGSHDYVGPRVPLDAVSEPVIEKLRQALEKRRRMLLVTALNGARRASLEGQELRVEFPAPARHLHDTLARSENAKTLREVCAEVFGREVGVKLTIRDAQDDQSTVLLEEEVALEGRSLRQTAEQHPAVQHVLRVFGGEIIDVRRLERDSESKT